MKQKRVATKEQPLGSSCQVKTCKQQWIILLFLSDTEPLQIESSYRQKKKTSEMKTDKLL